MENQIGSAWISTNIRSLKARSCADCTNLDKMVSGHGLNMIPKNDGSISENPISGEYNSNLEK